MVWSYNKTIRIWRSVIGYLFWTLQKISKSFSGRSVASGQLSEIGGLNKLKIKWKQMKISTIFQMCLQILDQIQSLCFSSDDEHSISLGGLDDGQIVVWNVWKRFALFLVFQMNFVVNLKKRIQFRFQMKWLTQTVICIGKTTNWLFQ